MLACHDETRGVLRRLPADLPYHAGHIGVLRARAVALSPGPSFGTAGAGFARLNFATTRTLLEQAVRRMTAAAAG